MSDTETTRRSPKPRDVDYTLEVVDDLPETPQQERRSVLEDALELVKAGGNAETPIPHGKFACIGRYHLGSAASAAANVLRQRHGGDATVEGWTIRTKRLGGDDDRTGLFVRYTPDAIVEGARAQWDEKEKQRKAELAAKKEAAKAESNGAADQSNEPEQDVPAPQPEAESGGRRSRRS